MKRAAARSFALAGVLLTLGCAGPVTEIVVVVESELDVPSEIDGARIEVLEPSTTDTDQSTFTLRPGEPATLGVVHQGGPLGPLVIRVEGTLGSDIVVHTAREVSFTRERIMRLDIPLTRQCQIPVCPSSQSCDANGQCNPHRSGTLRAWTGSTGALHEADAGL